MHKPNKSTNKLKPYLIGWSWICACVYFLGKVERNQGLGVE